MKNKIIVFGLLAFCCIGINGMQSEDAKPENTKEESTPNIRFTEMPSEKTTPNDTQRELPIPDEFTQIPEFNSQYQDIRFIKMKGTFVGQHEDRHEVKVEKVEHNDTYTHTHNHTYVPEKTSLAHDFLKYLMVGSAQNYGGHLGAVAAELSFKLIAIGANYVIYWWNKEQFEHIERLKSQLEMQKHVIESFEKDSVLALNRIKALAQTAKAIGKLPLPMPEKKETAQQVLAELVQAKNQYLGLTYIQEKLNDDPIKRKIVQALVNGAQDSDDVVIDEE